MLEVKQKPRKRVRVIRTIAVREKNIYFARRKIHSPEDAEVLGRELLADLDKEHLLVCCLDNKNQPVSMEIVGIGLVNSCLVCAREVFKNAILSNATSIILFHNHPSGDPKPSLEDEAVTNKMKAAGCLLGIELLDHIIVGNIGEKFSFAKQNCWKYKEKDNGRCSGKNLWLCKGEQPGAESGQAASCAEGICEGREYIS